jgi:hypothetical protein
MRTNGTDRGRMADHHDEVELAPDRHLGHAVAVLGSVEGDALDRARQSLKQGPLIRSSRHKNGSPAALLLFPSCSGFLGAILVSSNCPVSVRLGQHHRIW